ncbi:hypothetical protein GCM10008090_33400 [Arenicella chitinivorans]|uniref:Tyrosinase copper-binding domain-containing protein n=1 Tax=Arenicella chitinivorans TaxID=1329800 RepID=A0A918S266_9GAMM|nr:tyrosinase family protein [Arenicella chitinivorans]GHA20784.1 hypothetical protein GCM10008090_33400 [Arenicella chitinivorans]
MTAYTRSNAWNSNGTFDNQDLYWYAKGVGVMQSRTLDDPNSWWFFAAIHGEYVSGTESGYPGWAYIPPAPSVPTSPLPSSDVLKQYWNQCQHQSWYFLPWHRGYLIALELQLREAIVSLGGPQSWSLPYWNYLGPGNEYHIPPAFTEQTLPDGEDNPLFVTARFGPKSDGNIYVEIPPVNQDCLTNDVYTGSSPNTPRPGFGGPETDFWHGGGQSGNLENNPHNQVHVDVGGDAPGNGIGGLMSDPGLAALDPIFYLHHCNIDRLWAVWNANGNKNPTSARWLKGPAATGNREFVMPKPGSTAWVFTPQEVDAMSKVDYTYEGLSADIDTTDVLSPVQKRLARFGINHAEVTTMASDTNKPDSELLGAHDHTLTIGSAGVRAAVKLNPAVKNTLLKTLASAAVDQAPDRTYLQLENVRGKRDANKLIVYVNGKLAGSIALFGLRRASLKEGEHGGSGLDLELDITEIIDALHLEQGLGADSLDVRIQPDKSITNGEEISVGRIGVYRESSS